ncbi:hypothetical protein QBC39DRAFT_254074 [Podospora conica]|nr:hypothetical protein QBC39DRAFT_254074 [Schizothecium conicum]
MAIPDAAAAADPADVTIQDESTEQSDQQPLQLCTLPPEIITTIFEFLVPQKPDLGETRPVSYEKLDEGELWYDHTRSRRGLWSMCQVSRQLSTIARPLLYRVVALLSEESMFLFFRTLTDQPHYGLWTRYLSVHLTLTRETVIRETRRAVGRLLRTFRPAKTPAILLDPIRVALEIMEISLPALSTYEGDFDDVPQVIVSFILMFLTRLDTLLLQVPVCDDHPEYEALFIKLAAAREHFQQFGNTPEHAALTPFQRIHTLLLQGDPELLAHFDTDDCSCEVPELYGAQPRRYHAMFAALPALRTLEVSSDDGAWNSVLEDEHNFLSGGTVDPYLRGLREIYLHDSVTCPIHLHQILRNAPDLETLYMTPRIDPRFEERNHHHHHHVPAEPDPMALDVALINHAHNLRELDVAWYDCYGCYNLIGPEGRLASLANNTKLEKLCVQLAVLFGASPMTSAEGRGVAGPLPLADLLPPNLVELTLEDWWWSSLDVYEAMRDWRRADKLAYYRDNAEYRRRAVAMMSYFATGFRARLGRLRKVLLLCKIPWAWEMAGSNGEVDAAFHFRDVKEVFREQGVEFSVETV